MHFGDRRGGVGRPAVGADRAPERGQPAESGAADQHFLFRQADRRARARSFRAARRDAAMPPTARARPAHAGEVGDRARRYAEVMVQQPSSSSRSHSMRAPSPWSSLATHDTTTAGPRPRRCTRSEKKAVTRCVTAVKSARRPSTGSPARARPRAASPAPAHPRRSPAPRSPDAASSSITRRASTGPSSCAASNKPGPRRSRA